MPTSEQRNAFIRATNLIEAGHLEDGMSELAASGIVDKHVDEHTGEVSFSMRPEYAEVFIQARKDMDNVG